MKRVMEGSRAVAEMVRLCRPQVISAYPITPQTHIVENLAGMVANGELNSEFVNVESEFSAASLVLGASATGARAFTASSSQGILLMTEVVYNIAGLRLPVVMTVANRAISSPLNIWNDHQDSVSVRDAGWIQLYAEDIQEAADLHLIAYRVAEDRRVLLPVMVCMDGYVLTHSYEPVDIPEQGQVDAFLPPYQALYKLDPADPLTFGAFADPNYYMEARYLLHRAVIGSQPVIEQALDEFSGAFGRKYQGLVESYRTDDATEVLVALGSLVTTLRDVVDELREQGRRVGAVKLRSLRPFPKQALREALGRAEKVAVLEKCLSLGGGGILTPEVRAALYGQAGAPEVSGFIVGLGGRSIPPRTVHRILDRLEGEQADDLFADLRPELLGDPTAGDWKSGWERVTAGQAVGVL